VYYAGDQYANSSPAPPVIINQYHSGVGGYGTYPESRGTQQAPESSAPPVTKSSYYLLAFPNGSVVMAVAYWTRDNMLHYVTRDKQEHQIAIGALDLEMTQQLNRERGITFEFK